MINTRQIPPEVIDALERAITRCVEDRIEKDPNVEDAYLRVSLVDNKFTVRAMYIEESLKDEAAGENDVALLDLMVDLNDCCGDEDWVINPDAIRDLAEEFLEVIDIDFCLN